MYRWLNSILRKSGLHVTRASRLEGLDYVADIRKLLGDRKLGVILDVGANVGQSALRFNAGFKGMDIHCFEPVEKSFHEGRRRTSGYPNITWHHTAVGNRNASVTFYSAGRSETSSIHDTAADPNCNKVDVNHVPITRLDDFCAEQGITTVGMVKTDTEGFDLDVIAGAGGLLDSASVECIVCEVGFKRSDSSHSYFGDIAAYLDGHGFTFVNLYGLAPIGHFQRYGCVYADALFARHT